MVIGPKCLLLTRVGALQDSPGPSVGACSENGQSVEPLPRGGSCWLPADLGLPGAHVTTSYSRSKALTDDGHPSSCHQYAGADSWREHLAETSSLTQSVLERDGLPLLSKQRAFPAADFLLT